MKTIIIWTAKKMQTYKVEMRRDYHLAIEEEEKKQKNVKNDCTVNHEFALILYVDPTYAHLVWWKSVFGVESLKTEFLAF